MSLSTLRVQRGTTLGYTLFTMLGTLGFTMAQWPVSSFTGRVFLFSIITHFGGKYSNTLRLLYLIFYLILDLLMTVIFGLITDDEAECHG